MKVIQALDPGCFAWDMFQEGKVIYVSPNDIIVSQQLLLTGKALKKMV